MTLLKWRIAALCVLSLTLGSSLLGCASQETSPGEGSKNTQAQTSPVSGTTSNSKGASTTPASGTSARDDGSASVPGDSSATPVTPDDNPALGTTQNDPSSEASDPFPAGYTLEQNCAIGTGSTGLDIYYRMPPSDSLRYVCVHRIGTSPSINYGDSTFALNLADVGGPFCAFSTVDENVGCALSPITPTDLMNVPPPRDQQQQVQSQQPTPDQRSLTTEQQPVQSQQPSPGLSNNRYYNNSKGNEVHSPAYSTNGSVPQGATAQCADGKYDFSQSRSGTCSRDGGVAQWLP